MAMAMTDVQDLESAGRLHRPPAHLNPDAVREGVAAALEIPGVILADANEGLKDLDDREIARRTHNRPIDKIRRLPAYTKSLILKAAGDRQRAETNPPAAAPEPEPDTPQAKRDPNAGKSLLNHPAFRGVYDGIAAKPQPHTAAMSKDAAARAARAKYPGAGQAGLRQAEAERLSKPPVDYSYLLNWRKHTR